jgi:hypothetical protein
MRWVMRCDSSAEVTPSSFFFEAVPRNLTTLGVSARNGHFVMSRLRRGGGLLYIVQIGAIEAIYYRL